MIGKGFQTVLIGMVVLLAACHFFPAGVERVAVVAKKAVNWEKATKEVLEVLGREEMQFLVTNTIQTSVILEETSSSLVLGKAQGILVARVTVYVGIDGFSAKDLRARNGKIIVTVPNPKILDFSVDFKNSRFISKRSGLVALVDLLEGEDMASGLYQKLESATLIQLSSDKLLPDRNEIIRRLNAHAVLLNSQIGGGVTVEFI